MHLFQGIRIKIDKLGNVWIKKHIDLPVCVQCAQYPEPIFLTNDYRKIIDLRSFRDSILHELDVKTNVDKERLFKKSIIFIKVDVEITEIREGINI